LLTIEAVAEAPVTPPVPLTAHQRRVAALDEHRPKEFPAGPGWVIRSPILKIRGIVAEVYGETAAEAVDGLLRPSAKVDRVVARRILDATLPATRPIKLAIPDVRSAAAYDQALSIVHEAWTTGQISPEEADLCMRLINRRYSGWLKAKTGTRVK
jgi:hypothetical protein